VTQPIDEAPPLAAGGLPLRLLLDFDGTICLTSVSDTVMADHSVRPGWLDLDREYEAGRLGSREELARFMDLLPDGPRALVETAERQPLDPTFAAFAAAARRHGVGVEVVSDGFGFYVAPALARLGAGDLPIATARMRWGPGGRPEISFPYGHPACFVCGTCKRQRVLAHQARGAHVAFVGDGVSDRYAAEHADTVFAKDLLVGACEAAGIPYRPWSDFADVAAWLEDVAADPAGLDPPRPRPFICGPEAWGPGRTAPGPGSRST
jgi:HAD superfamily phosphoserine phosphatase-like hydrolase